MSNVYPLLPRLIVNGRFIGDFLAAPAPCCALGLLEERQTIRGLLALRPAEAIPPAVSNVGFNFGHSLLGTADFEVVHFAFQFYGFATYQVLLNPNNPLVRTVLKTMVASGDYFFLVLDPDQGVTAFRSDIEPQQWVGLKDHLERILRSKTTEAQYRQAVAHFQRKLKATDHYLNWVCRDTIEYLDLTQDRLEMSPSAGTPPRRGDDSVNPGSPSAQPLSMLPTLATIIDEQLANAREQHVSLLDVRDCPEVLDDDLLHRLLRLYSEQLEDLPRYREQLAIWRHASPTPAQRGEIARLGGQLERHETLVHAVLELAKELQSGTIDAILRMEEGELGMAIFEGRRKPPAGEPPSEALRVAEQRAIAEVLDARVEELEQAGLQPLQWLGHLAPQMPMFHRLMEISSEAEMDQLCQQYPALYRFAKLLERIAAGIRSGAIQVPR